VTCLTASTEVLQYVHQPRGVPSYWKTRRRIGNSGHAIAVRFLVHDSGQPCVEQEQLAEDLARRFEPYFFEALVLMRPAFARHIVEQRGLRMLTEEFVLNSVDLLPPTAETTGHVLFFRCISDPRYVFAVTFRGERSVRLSVDRDDS